jgi:hypothetical protein
MLLPIMCWNSVAGIVTGWTVRGSNPGGGKIFRTRPDRPWGPPSFITVSISSFPGVKQPGRSVDHSSHLAPRSKKEWSYISTPRLDLCGLFWGELYLYLYPYLYCSLLLALTVWHIVQCYVCERTRDHKMYEYKDLYALRHCSEFSGVSLFWLE